MSLSRASAISAALGLPAVGCWTVGAVLLGAVGWTLIGIGTVLALVAFCFVVAAREDRKDQPSAGSRQTTMVTGKDLSGAEISGNWSSADRLVVGDTLRDAKIKNNRHDPRSPKNPA